MRIDQITLRRLSVVFWVLIMVSLNYNLYRKYQSISACHGQQARLDAIEAQLGGAKK
jgi:hypothetical protein